MMEKILEKMNPNKRDQLIDAAMKVFGEHGYDKASTNVIVKESGISKGLLYHYFPTKKILYETLSTYSMTLIGDAIEAGMNWDEGDILKRLKDITMIKLSLFKKYPNLLDFTKTLSKDLSIDAYKEKIYKHIPNLYEKVFSYKVDFSVFKDDVDVSKAITLLQYFLDKYSENISLNYIVKNNQMDLNKIEKELNDYLDLYRLGFYK